MTTYRIPPSSSRRGSAPVLLGPLRALQLIESVGDAEPFRIAPIRHAYGSVVSPAERMAAKVKWAERAQYTVLTWEVPARFAPYNSVIRVSAAGTEDKQLDYLAELIPDTSEDPQ